MWLKRIGMMGCIMLCVAGLAACGSSNKKTTSSSTTSASTPATSASTTATSTSTTASGSTSTSTGATTTAAAAKGTPFALGFICSCSGAEAASLAGVDKVIDAWASSVNASGGVNGHPVNVIVEDDGGTPASALQDAKALVSKHVIGIVDMSVADAAFAPYVTAQGIPVVGGDGTLSTFITEPDFFPSNTQLPASIVGLAILAKQQGAKHFGIAYCAEAPVCAQLNPLGKAAAAAAGIGYSSISVSATAPSYAAPCLQLKSDGVDAFYVADNPAVTVRVFDSCVQQGFHPKFAGNMGGLSNAVVADKNLNGGIAVGGAANPYDPSTPAVAQFDAALQKYDPGVVGTSELKYTDIMAWTGGKLFQAAAEAGDLTPSSTPAQLKAALYKLHNETLGGLAPPLNFVAGKPTFLPCFFTIKFSGEKFVSENGNKPTCLTATQSKAAGG